MITRGTANDVPEPSAGLSIAVLTRADQKIEVQKC